MKKLILLFVAVAITAGAYAQADSTSKKISSPNSNYGTNQNRDKNNSGTNQKLDNYNYGTNQNNNKQNQDMQNTPLGKSHADGVMMQNGKIMKVKNGQTTSLEGDDITMSNGTKINRDGTCTSKDGKKVMMKEGQHMDMSGKMTSMRTNKDKDMYLVPDSTRK